MSSAGSRGTKVKVEVKVEVGQEVIGVIGGDVSMYPGAETRSCTLLLLSQ
jgi:hypothetical protein